MKKQKLTKINFGSLNYKGWEAAMLPLKEQCEKFETLNLTEEEFKWEIIINQEDKK